MPPIRRVTFAFDERDFVPLDRLIKQGRTDPGPYDEVPVTHPETGETQILVIPRNHTMRRSTILSLIGFALAATAAPAQCPGGRCPVPTTVPTVVRQYQPAVAYQPVIQAQPVYQPTACQVAPVARRLRLFRRCR